MTLDTDYMPVGAIVALGRTLDESNDTFLLCDGSGLDMEEYSELYDVIGRLYGEDPEKNEFYLPDCRGLFLRGADMGSGNDPDTATRFSLVDSGRTLSAEPVGTIQEYSTARPQSNEFSCTITLQNSTTRQHGETSGPVMGQGSNKSIDTCTGGGDPDTRPVNVYVEYYIKARS